MSQYCVIFCYEKIHRDRNRCGRGRDRDYKKWELGISDQRKTNFNSSKFLVTQSAEYFQTLLCFMHIIVLTFLIVIRLWQIPINILEKRCKFENSSLYYLTLTFFYWFLFKGSCWIATGLFVLKGLWYGTINHTTFKWYWHAFCYWNENFSLAQLYSLGPWTSTGITLRVGIVNT